MNICPKQFCLKIKSFEARDVQKKNFFHTEVFEADMVPKTFPGFHGLFT